MFVYETGHNLIFTLIGYSYIFTKSSLWFVINFSHVHIALEKYVKKSKSTYP